MLTADDRRAIAAGWQLTGPDGDVVELVDAPATCAGSGQLVTWPLGPTWPCDSCGRVVRVVPIGPSSAGGAVLVEHYPPNDQPGQRPSDPPTLSLEL